MFTSQAVDSRLAWIRNGGRMPSKGDIPAWQQAANLLTHEAWGSHVIRWASAKVPDERLLRADRRPFSITAVSTMHPTWGQTSEQVIEMERLGLAIRSGHTAKASLRTFMKNLGGKPSLRYKATWTDDARVNVQMTKLLREFAGEVEGLGISFSQASWLPDFDGRTPPAWSEMESFHQELNKDGTNEHPRISSSSIAGLLKALGVDPKIDFNTLLQSARNQRSESGAKRNLRAYGGQLGEVLADFLTLKEAQNFWYIIADCGDGARVNHPGKEFCEAWDTLALTLILKKLGIRIPKVVALLETDFYGGRTRMRHWMPEGPWEWISMAACSDLGRRNGILHSALGIAAALHIQTPEKMYLGQGCSIYRVGIGMAGLIRCLPQTLRHLTVTVQGSGVWELAMNPRAAAASVAMALDQQMPSPDHGTMEKLMEVLRVERDVYAKVIRQDAELAGYLFRWINHPGPCMGSRPFVRPGLGDLANPLEGLRAISIAGLQELTGLPLCTLGAGAALTAGAPYLRSLLKHGFPAAEVALSIIQELTQEHDLLFAETVATQRMLEGTSEGFMAMIRASRAVAETFKAPLVNVRTCAFDQATMARLRLVQSFALQSENADLLQQLAALRFAAYGQTP